MAIAGTIADTATADVVDPATLEAFEGAVAASRAAAAEADEALAATGADVGADAAAESGGTDTRPFWPWELAESEDELTRDDREARDTVASLRELRERFDAAVAAVDAAAPALFASTRAAADRLQAENPSARSTDVVAFRSATDAVAARQDVTRESSDALVAFVVGRSAAAGVEPGRARGEGGAAARPAARRRGLREIAGRRRAHRLRLGADRERLRQRWHRGRARCVDRPTAADHATITLSDSVAAFWPSALSQALVAHEVGHAVSVRCGDRFDASTRAANEAWATAWAISRGFTGDGNGVSIYGSPPQELIDAAATCR